MLLHDEDRLPAVRRGLLLASRRLRRHPKIPERTVFSQAFTHAHAAETFMNARQSLEENLATARLHTGDLHIRCQERIPHEHIGKEKA